MSWLVRVVAVAGMAVGIACAGRDSGSGGGGDDFYGRLDAGTECRELFEIRNALDPKDPEIPEMNDALREIGCYSITSKRTD
ncbi:MAG: hypothetical protein M3285_02775 [Actinomycetota bacterium]|nr:hypothetical protein [Actinomycetota bacterium]MDQ3954455.1 hypothetical protein [Actinomycetota bacterium]